MAKKTNNGYKEVRLDENGRGADRFYRNPLTKVYQYEYALYETVSELFASVRCRSLCVNSLNLYFKELPLSGAEEKDTWPAQEEGQPKKVTREKILSEMRQLVSRDVIGHVTFPMMNVCAAEVRAIPEKDGTHTFLFTDGIYGFTLHLDMPYKGHPKGIRVADILC